MLALAKGLASPLGSLLNSPSIASCGAQPELEQAKEVALHLAWQLAASQHQ